MAFVFEEQIFDRNSIVLQCLDEFEVLASDSPGFSPHVQFVDFGHGYGSRHVVIELHRADGQWRAKVCRLSTSDGIAGGCVHRGPRCAEDGTLTLSGPPTGAGMRGLAGDLVADFGDWTLEARF